MSLHPSKQLALIIDEETNCGKDLAQLIISFDIVDFRLLKFDLIKVIKDRVDSCLTYEKARNKKYLDYKIRTIIHGFVLTISFTTFIDNQSLDQFLVTRIAYNGLLMTNDLPSKSLYKLNKEELMDFIGHQYSLVM